jgi:hypothetical protein
MKGSPVRVRASASLFKPFLASWRLSCRPIGLVLTEEAREYLAAQEQVREKRESEAAGERTAALNAAISQARASEKAFQVALNALTEYLEAAESAAEVRAETKAAFRAARALGCGNDLPVEPPDFATRSVRDVEIRHLHDRLRAIAMTW